MSPSTPGGTVNLREPPTGRATTARRKRTFLYGGDTPTSVLRDGHLGAALLAYAPVGLALVDTGTLALAAVGLSVAVSLTMVPDYDQRVGFVSHRGVTHTLLFAVLVGVLVGGAAGVLGGAVGLTIEGPVAPFGVAAPGSVLGVDLAPLAVFGFLVGTLTTLSHLGADVLTPSGVPLLWPLSDYRFSLGLFTADTTAANYGLLVAGVLATLGWASALFGV